MAGMKHGAWCHIEIPTAAPENSKKFYAGLFGWSFTHVPEMKYTIYNAGEGEIGGGLFDPPPGTPRQITNYITVADLEAAAKKVPELGGRVCTDRMEVPGMGSFRIVADPDGNSFGLWQANRAAAAAKKPQASKRTAAKKPAPRAKKRR